MKPTEHIENLIHEGKHFCIYPWVHLYVTGLGYLSPCCISNSQGFGNLNKSSFKDLWQSEAIRSFRLKMLNDEEDSNCTACYETESAGNTSVRQQSNLRFRKYIDWVANTDYSGYAPDAKPVSWDIRFSNKCNLRCRTCSSASSSAWYKDEIALSMNKAPQRSGSFLEELYTRFITGLKDTKKLLADLEEYFPFLDHLYCAGGEPLLIEENLCMLEKLDLMGKYDLDLVYNTNMTQLHKNNKFSPIWKSFRNLTLIISLDGDHRRGEYIRKGIKWDTVLSNLEFIKQECPHINILVNFTVSAFNIIHLPDFHREIVEKGYLRADQINLNILHFAKMFSTRILPKDLKKLAADKILEHAAWLKQQPPFNELVRSNDLDYESFIRQWYACINHMNADDWTHMIPEFLEHTRKLDELRNESFLSVFPELESIVNYKA